MNDPQPVQAGAELALREALIACGRNAGAFLADGVSDEFLKLVPGEVQGRVQALTDELTRLREKVGRMEALLALADETLMTVIGHFPLDEGPVRAACLAIRTATGEDYQARKDAARQALADQPS